MENVPFNVVTDDQSSYSALNEEIIETGPQTKEKGTAWWQRNNVIKKRVVITIFLLSILGITCGIFTMLKTDIWHWSDDQESSGYSSGMHEEENIVSVMKGKKNDKKKGSKRSKRTTTQAPTTAAPTTQAPTTAAPTTQAPTTAAPTTTTGNATGNVTVYQLMQLDEAMATDTTLLQRVRCGRFDISPYPNAEVAAGCEEYANPGDSCLLRCKPGYAETSSSQGTCDLGVGAAASASWVSVSIECLSQPEQN